MNRVRGKSLQQYLPEVRPQPQHFGAGDARLRDISDELPLALGFVLRFITDSGNGNHYEVWAPFSVLRVPIGERFQVHSEFFGLFSEDRASNFSRVFFSPGMHYLITPNLEVGLRVGWGLTNQSSPFFSNVGFGCRF